MAIEKYEVQLAHKGEIRSCQLRKGLNLQALTEQTDWLEFDCRKADCGICILKVRDGADFLSPPTAAEAYFLRAMRADSDERLACQCRVFGPVSLEIEDPLVY